MASNLWKPSLAAGSLSGDKELARGSLCTSPLGSKPLRRQWAVLSLAGRRWNLAEETFFRLCHTVTAGYRMDRKDLPKPNER